MRRIAVVTVGRSDYSYLRPVVRELCAGGLSDVGFIVGGAHLVPEMGLTVNQIERDGMPIAARVEMTPARDDVVSIAESIAVGVKGFAHAYEKIRPDVVLLLGDRYEMLAAAVAALPLGLVMGHIAGGESSEGAMDEQTRHAITKFSHLHFVSTAKYRERVIRMGENPENVHLTGAPSIDVAVSMPVVSKAELEGRFGIALDPAPLLVTYHPATLDAQSVESQIAEVLGAIEQSGLPAVFTEPNADQGSRAILDRIHKVVESNPKHRFVSNFGPEAYFSVLRHVAAMVGNSSSGIIEAATFGVPVVNVGSRQRGRVHGDNVLDCACERDVIAGGIRQATDAAFRARVSRMENPYGKAGAAAAIARVLERVDLNDSLRMKRFVE